MLHPFSDAEVNIEDQVIRSYQTTKDPEAQPASTTLTDGNDKKFTRNSGELGARKTCGLEGDRCTETHGNGSDGGMDDRTDAGGSGNSIDGRTGGNSIDKRNEGHGQSKGDENNANNDTGRAGNHDSSSGGSGGGGSGGFHGQGGNERNMHSKHVLTLTPQYVDLIPKGSAGFAVSDRDSSVEYSSGWDLFVISPHTFHSTSQVGSSLRHTFNGTQIIVMGLLPSGNVSVSANYSIDGGPSQSNTLEALSGTRSPVGNTTYFSSSILPLANHTIDIVVTQTGLGRNYTVDYFEIVVSSEPSSSLKDGRQTSEAKAGSIVGGVIGALVFFVFVAFLYWFLVRRFRRRRVPSQTIVAQLEGKTEYGINPYTYESRIVVHSNEKTRTVLGRSPPGNATRSAASLDPTSSCRNSLDAIHNSASSGSETSSQTFVNICNGTEDRPHLPVMPPSARLNDRWNRQILV